MKKRVWKRRRDGVRQRYWTGRKRLRSRWIPYAEKLTTGTSYAAPTHEELAEVIARNKRLGLDSSFESESFKDMVRRRKEMKLKFKDVLSGKEEGKRKKEWEDRLDLVLSGETPRYSEL